MIKLKELRKEKGITQKEIADIIKTNQESISRLEKGKSTINNIQIVKLCQF